MLGAAAAAIGAGKLVSGMANRRTDHRDEEYSAVSTETPRRHRPGRGGGTTLSEFSSEYTDYPRRPDETQTSLLPPSAYPAGRGRTDHAGRRPMTPEPLRSRGRDFDESEYSSYVSPSRRPQDRGHGEGVAKGILGGLGMGWLAKKLADRRAKKEEDRLRDEEDSRSGVSGSRFTGDGYPSPSRRDSRRPSVVRRGTGYPTDTLLSTEITESSIETRPVGSSYTARPSTAQAGAAPPFVPVPGPGNHSRSHSQVRHDPVAMPPMPPDPHGILHSVGGLIRVVCKQPSTAPSLITSQTGQRKGR